MNSAIPDRTILIVAYNFPPRAVHSAARTAAIARNLALNGWKVLVLTCAPDGSVARDEVWASQLEEHGVQIIRTKVLKRYELNTDGSVRIRPLRLRRMGRWLKQWTRQPDVMVSWKKEATQTIEKILAETTVNMLYAAAPPFSNFTLVQEIAEHHHIPFAVDYGESWLDNPNHSYPTPLHRRQSASMEESILKQAAMIFTTTRRTKEDLLRRCRFLTHEEIMIVPHGFDASEFFALTPAPHQDCIITCYQDFSEGESPRMMFKALRMLMTKREDVREHLKIHVIGLMRDGHRSLVRKWKLQNNIMLHGFLDRPRSLQMMMDATILWFAAEKDSDAGSALVGEYLGTRKPLLISAPLGTILSTAMDCATVYHCEYSKVNKIAASLEEVFDTWKSGDLRSSDATKLAQYNYAHNGKEISRVLGMAMKM